MSKTVFETSQSWSGRRYLVESRGESVSWVYPERWFADRYYDELSSAVYRAETLVHKGADESRVVDTEDQE